MAELFENMEKMDIQAERRNTEEQRLRAEAAEQEAKNAKQQADASIAMLITSCHDMGIPLETVLLKLTDGLGLSEPEAKSMTEQYWNGFSHK